MSGGTVPNRMIAPLLAVVLVAGALVVAIVQGRHADEQQVTVADSSRAIAVQLADMHIVPSQVSVAAGTRLVLDVTDVDQMPHDLYIDGGPRTRLLGHGESATLDLGPVTHSMDGWCTVPGHKAAGMTMTITVVGGATTMPGMNAPHASGRAATIDPSAAPAPDWQPYDPALLPATGATEHRVTFTIRDSRVEVAPGVRQTRWTYNGTAPGPILHGHVGDLFVVTVVNHGDMAHGIDFHAGSVDPDGPMRAIAPGKSLRYEFKADYSGAWLYHCSTMPMSLHIANGMFGAVIIDPPDLRRVDQQFVLVQSELYLGPQGGSSSETKIAAEKPDAIVFNGYYDQYKYAPIQVRTGERIRVWIVDAGPQFGTSFHVVGTQFDAVFKEGAYLLRPGNPAHGASQAIDLSPGQGGFVEFTLPAPGQYPFVDHAMVDAERGASGIFLAR